MGNLIMLKAERVKHGLTQKEMAEIIGCSTPAYNQKEKGRRKFSQDEISVIVRRLGLSGEMIKAIFFDE